MYAKKFTIRCPIRETNKGSFILYVRTKGGKGVKQNRTPCLQGGGGLTRGSTYAKTSLFCTCFVIFSYAGSFYHALLSLA